MIGCFNIRSLSTYVSGDLKKNTEFEASKSVRKVNRVLCMDSWFSSEMFLRHVVFNCGKTIETRWPEGERELIKGVDHHCVHVLQGESGQK